MVVPAAGIGTGYADLPRHAPAIDATIKRRIRELEVDIPRRLNRARGTFPVAFGGGDQRARTRRKAANR